MKHTLLSGEEVRRLLGHFDDDKIAAVMRLAPSREDLEAALSWAGGETEIMSEVGQHASGKVGRIVEILSSETEWEEEDERA